VGKLEGRRSFGRPRRRWQANIKWIFERLDGAQRLDRSRSGWGEVADSCECSDEPSGSIKYVEFLE
jgi:hypothetical protein